MYIYSGTFLFNANKYDIYEKYARIIVQCAKLIYNDNLYIVYPFWVYLQ